MTARRGAIRAIKRSREEVAAAREFSRANGSLLDGLTSLTAKACIQGVSRGILRRSPSVDRLLIRKHSVVLEYLDKEFADFFLVYGSGKIETRADADWMTSDQIWLCWWQGCDRAPALVQRCVESVVSNRGTREVVLLSEGNFRDFVNLPDWICRRWERDEVSNTHFSDILRPASLSQNGGLWLDSTFFCSRPVSWDASICPVFTISRPRYGYNSVAGGRFANYALGAAPSHRQVFQVILDYLLEYWRRNDLLVDYLLTDYMIVLAQKYVPSVHRAFSIVAPNNPACDDLQAVLNQPYSDLVWSKLNKETSLYKLSWKSRLLLERGGKETFAARLLSASL